MSCKEFKPRFAVPHLTTSVFSGVGHISHSSKLPEGATKEQAIAMLSDHIFFLHCDPHLQKYDTLTPDAPPEVPEAIQAKIRGNKGTEVYQVTDLVHTIPAGLWDSNVVSTYEITDITDGLFVRIRSPLSIVMDTVWEIKEGEDGKLELAETITIKCSRFLLGIVTSQCEGGWQKIHAKMLGKLEEKEDGQEGETRP